MFFRLLGASIVRRKLHNLLVAASVWVGLTLVVALLVLGLDVGDKMNRELQSFGANISVTPPTPTASAAAGGGEVAERPHSAGLLEEDLRRLKSIFWRNNILGISPRLWARGWIENQEVLLLGLWFDERIPVESEIFLTGARQVYPHWRVEGSWPSAEYGAKRRCLVGVSLARKLDVSVGDTIHVASRAGGASFIVSGTVSAGGEEDGALLAQLSSIQELAGTPGGVSSADITALTTPENALAEKYRLDPEALTPAEYERWVCTPYPGVVAAEIQNTVDGSVARVVRRISETQGTVLRRIEGLMFLLAVLTLIASSLGVMAVISSAVAQRRDEVALMRAVGARRSNVWAAFLAETGFLGIVGGAMAAATGLLLGAWLVRALFNSDPAPHLEVIVMAPVLGMVTAWCGCVWPLSRILQQSPALVLQEG